MSGENNMAPVSTPLMDAPTLGWGERMLSKKDIEKIDYVGDLGKHASDSDKQLKQRNADESAAHRKQREQGLTFTEPVKNEAGMAPIPKGKFPRQEGPEIDKFSLSYDWRITPAGTAETPAWTVGEGRMYYLNDATEATVASTSVAGEVGSIYMHVTRDPASRAVTAQVVEFYVETPLTGETDQYFELAAVGGDPAIIQKQFTPIRVYEDLFVVNGEFKLGNIAMLSDTLYAPPV